jgi:hypothetical protein
MVQSLRDTGYTFVPVTRELFHDALATVAHLSTLADDDLTHLVWTNADLGVVTAVVQDPGGGPEVDIDGTWHRLPVLDGHALVPARSRQASNGVKRVSLVLFAHLAAAFELAKTMPNPRWETTGDYLSYRLTRKGVGGP